jgi:hypothetical protein
MAHRPTQPSPIVPYRTTRCMRCWQRHIQRASLSSSRIVSATLIRILNVTHRSTLSVYISLTEFISVYNYVEYTKSPKPSLVQALPPRSVS